MYLALLRARFGLRQASRHGVTNVLSLGFTVLPPSIQVHPEEAITSISDYAHARVRTPPGWSFSAERGAEEERGGLWKILPGVRVLNGCLRFDEILVPGIASPTSCRN